MTTLDMNAPATLTWVSRQGPHQRHLNSVKDAVRIAMKELTRTEFFSAHVVTSGDAYSGDQIVQIFQTGGLPRPGYAAF